MGAADRCTWFRPGLCRLPGTSAVGGSADSGAPSPVLVRGAVGSAARRRAGSVEGVVGVPPGVDERSLVASGRLWTTGSVGPGLPPSTEPCFIGTAVGGVGTRGRPAEGGSPRVAGPSPPSAGRPPTAARSAEPGWPSPSGRPSAQESRGASDRRVAGPRSASGRPGADVPGHWSSPGWRAPSGRCPCRTASERCPRGERCLSARESADWPAPPRPCGGPPPRHAAPPGAAARVLPP